MILLKVSHYGKQRRIPSREHLVPIPTTLESETEFFVSNLSFFISFLKKSLENLTVTGNVCLLIP